MICLSRFSVLLFSFYRFATFIVYSMDAVRVCVLLWGINRGGFIGLFHCSKIIIKCWEINTKKMQENSRSSYRKAKAILSCSWPARRTATLRQIIIYFSFSCLLLILSWDRVEIRLINWYWNQTKKVRRKSKNAQKNCRKKFEKDTQKIIQKRKLLSIVAPRHKAVVVSAFPSNVICSNIYKFDKS